MFSSVRWSRVVLILLPIFAIVAGGCGVALYPDFSYQGRLLDNSGQPVADGDYEMTISIYQVASGGTEVFSQTQQIPVQDGLFTTSVGFAGDINPEIFAQPTWMEVAVEGETLSPRQRLEGSPFAFSLVPGAVIQGSESRDRTFGSFDDTGAVLTIWNQDASAGGGHALLTLNQAATSSADRDKSAALLAIAAGGQIVEGDPTQDTGATGAIIRSENYRGMYVRAGRVGASGYYGATFDSVAGIQIIGGGNCIGCATAYMARNTGTDTIKIGDFVSVSGVQLDAELNIPVMQVKKATSSSDAIVGVATGRANREPISDIYGAQVGGFEYLGGTAAPGDSVAVTVQGLVQANLGSSSGLEMGQRLDESAAQPAMGRLMSNPDKEGMAWVMLSGE